jgi:hypothetical protein
MKTDEAGADAGGASRGCSRCGAEWVEPTGERSGRVSGERNSLMPGKGHRFTAKEHRQVEHIKDSEVERGMPADEAERVGYATVNAEVGEKDASRRYTAKERRQAEHIEHSEEERGKSPSEAKSIAYATVNKQKSG